MSAHAFLGIKAQDPQTGAYLFKHSMVPGDLGGAGATEKTEKTKTSETLFRFFGCPLPPDRKTEPGSLRFWFFRFFRLPPKSRGPGVPPRIVSSPRLSVGGGCGEDPPQEAYVGENTCSNLSPPGLSATR